MTFLVVPVANQPGVLIPELAAYATDANIFSRVLASPFMVPSIVAALDAHRRKTLIVAGFSAEVAVLQTVLDALAAGYAVHVPMDAIGSRSERTEAPAMRQFERAGAIGTSVLSLVTRWAPDFSRPPGSETLKALAALR